MLAHLEKHKFWC